MKWFLFTFVSHLAIPAFIIVGRYCVGGCQMRSHHEILYDKHCMTFQLLLQVNTYIFFYCIVYDKSVKVFTLFVLFIMNKKNCVGE